MRELDIAEKLRWLTRQNKNLQMEVFTRAFGEQGEEIRKKLAIAAEEIQDTMQRDKRKALDRETALEELAETHKLRIKALYKDRKGRRKSKLAKKVKLRLDLITQLRNEGLGWRMVAEYLRRYGGLQISYQQLRRLYQQLSQDK